MTQTTVRQLAITLGVNPDSYKDFESFKYALPVDNDNLYDVLDTWTSFDDVVELEHLALFGVQNQEQEQRQVKETAITTLEDAAIDSIDVSNTGMLQAAQARHELSIAKAKRQGTSQGILRGLAAHKAQLEAEQYVAEVIAFAEQESMDIMEEQTTNMVVDILQAIRGNYSETVKEIAITQEKTQSEIQYAQNAVEKIAGLKERFVKRRAR
jgi:malonyl CoA-acyl carrier protein transacylase